MGAKEGRCSYASSSQHACAAVLKSGCVAPAFDCPLCHCSLGAVAKKNVFIASLMGIERMKPRPTDAKEHAIKFTPTHIVFFFDLETVWHLRYNFSAGT